MSSVGNPRPVRWLLAAVALAVAAAACSSPAAPSPPPVPPAPVPPPPPPEPPPPPPPPPPPTPRIEFTRFLCFGDSLTEGEATPLFHDPSTPGVERSYPAKLQALMSARYADQTIRIFNGGRGGERASEGAARLAGLVRDLQPDVVILLTGVNDLNGGESIGKTIGAIETLINEAAGRGVRVLLSTLPPQRPGAPKAFSVDLIVPFNNELARLAPDEGATLVDIYPHVTLDLLAPDGLHLTEAGNVRLAERYAEALRGLYELPAALRSR